MENIMMLGLNGDAWITIVTLLGIILVMARTRVPAEVVFLGALTILLVTGIVTDDEVMAGFGSEPVVVHAAFFVVIAGLMQTGVLYWLTKHVLGSPRKFHNAVLRLMAPISLLAALLNSVNVVALFIDTVKIWARKLDIPASKLLMPLSYAASLGGMCTLLGNSSNLVIAGLYAKQTGKSLNIFEPLLPGIVLTVVGILLVVALQRLIPPRESPEQSFETTSDYTAELLVPTDHPFIAETVEDAGLYSIKGGSLIEIVRFDKEIIMPVSPDEPLMGGDRLIYAGQINEILELKRSHGLVAADHHVWSISEIDAKRKMRTAYVDFGSDLIGTKMTESDFERENDVVLVAVARQGKRVEKQPRQVRLQAGDSLLLECPPNSDRQIEQENRRRLTFFDSNFVPQTGPRTLVAAAILVMMFLLSSFHVLPLMAATMLAVGAMLLFRCCRMERVIKYIEWEVLLILGSIVVFPTAIAKTGITDVIAFGILDLCGSNPYAVMAVMCFLASIVTEFMSDVGSAAVFFPIIWQQAQMLGCNPMPFVMSLMLSVTISFASPIGSSTHILIYGPGAFRFTDFARLGIIMHVVLLVVCFLLVNLIYPLYI